MATAFREICSFHLCFLLQWKVGAIQDIMLLNSKFGKIMGTFFKFLFWTVLVILMNPHPNTKTTVILWYLCSSATRKVFLSSKFGRKQQKLAAKYWQFKKNQNYEDCLVNFPQNLEDKKKRWPDYLEQFDIIWSKFQKGDHS